MRSKPATSTSPKHSLRFLKDLARSVLKEHRNGLPSCCDILRNLKKFSDASDEEILGARVTLQQVHHALARANGHRNWASLRSTVTGIRDGDAGTYATRPKGLDRLFHLWGQMTESIRAARRKIAENMITDAMEKGVFGNLSCGGGPMGSEGNPSRGSGVPLNSRITAIGESPDYGSAKLSEKGKPLNLDAYFRTPEHLRMAYHVLKNAGYLPPEVELKREISALRKKRNATDDESEKRRLNREINWKITAYDMAIELSRER